MNIHYAVAVQLQEGQVQTEHFGPPYLGSPALWALVDKCTCRHNSSFDENESTRWYQRITIDFLDGQETISTLVKAPKGIDPRLDNEEILKKWRSIAGTVIPMDVVREIERLVLDLENVDDVEPLMALLVNQP